MHIRFLSQVSLMALAVLFSVPVLAQSSFPISYYPAEQVRSELDQEACTGIRIYPVINPSAQVPSTMIIGIDSDGNELYNSDSQAGNYLVFKGVEDTSPIDETIDKQKATAICSAYFAANGPFVVDVAASLVSACLANESAGLSVIFDGEGGSNFSVAGYTSEGGLRSSGSARPGDPCPTMCGEAQQYLSSPE